MGERAPGKVILRRNVLAFPGLRRAVKAAHNLDELAAVHSNPQLPIPDAEGHVASG